MNKREKGFAFWLFPAILSLMGVADRVQTKTLFGDPLPLLDTVVCGAILVIALLLITINSVIWIKYLIRKIKNKD